MTSLVQEQDGHAVSIPYEIRSIDIDIVSDYLDQYIYDETSPAIPTQKRNEIIAFLNEPKIYNKATKDKLEEICQDLLQLSFYKVAFKAFWIAREDEENGQQSEEEKNIIANALQKLPELSDEQVLALSRIGYLSDGGSENTIIREKEEEHAVSIPYEIRLPLSNSLIEFLIKPYPNEEVCRLFNYETIKGHEFTLFNLNSCLQRHMTFKEDVYVKKPTKEFAKMFSISSEEGITKYKVYEIISKYVKENNLQHPIMWYRYRFDNALRKIKGWDVDDDEDYECEPYGEGGEPESCGCIFDDLFSEFNFSDGYDAKMYKISNELANFLSVPKDEEISRMKIFESVLKYVKDNKLQHPLNGRIIVPDEKLRKILEKEKCKETEIEK
tara:strand:- start:32 stop:1183 length:1152 start_codon:yes stop_codon:yes gene_type:complete